MTYEGRLFVGGRFVEAKSGATFPNLNPATEELICNVALADADDIDFAVDAAGDGAKAWVELSPSERGVILHTMAEAIEANGDELAQLDSIDAGKPLGDCKEDVHAAVNLFRYFAGMADRTFGNTIPVQNDKFCYTRREPYGVVAAITAWNYPLFNACAKLAPILAMGNSVILKPAEETPLVALRLAEVLQSVDGAPAGLINVLNGPGEVTGASLTSHMGIGKVSFTGGTETGRLVMKSAADSNLKSVTLELGGKGPFLIFADADIESALNAIVFSVFYNQGQTCTAGTRLLVEHSIRESVEQGLKERIERITVGMPSELDTMVGPVISKTQFDKITGYIRRAQSSNLRLLCGGPERPANFDAGYFLSPTVILDANPESEIYRDEVFGPVLVLNSFGNVDEAIHMANDTRYGLSASVWTNDVRSLLKLVNSIQAGVVWGNTTFAEHPGAPLGGFGQSGFGREFGEGAVEEYTRSKTVWISLSGEFEAWA